MKKSYRTLEFSFIQDYIKNYCFSEMAKKRIDQIQPFQDIDDLKLYQDDISSAMKIIYAYGRIPLAPYEDIKEILQKAQKGGVCYPQDLLKIVQILKNVQEVQAYLDQEIEQSHLLEILSLLYLPKDLYNEILKCVDPSGNIYDHASHELYRLRRQISAIEANMRKKIEALRAQNKDYYLMMLFQQEMIILFYLSMFLIKLNQGDSSWTFFFRKNNICRTRRNCFLQQSTFTN